jgi:hypothetical protein
MGMDLVNKQGNVLDISETWWWWYLNFAQHYGWEPLGTKPPEGLSEIEEWDGTYMSCDGQLVVEADANSFASALQKGVADPGSTSIVEELNEEIRKYLEEVMGGPLNYELDSKVDVEYTNELIGFLKQGEFKIE